MRLPRFVKMPDTGQFLKSWATLAATGSLISDGAQINSQVVSVTAANGTKAVVLPSAQKGMEIVVVNTDASNTLPVFPFNGDSAAINAGSANASFVVGAGRSATFHAESKTQWRVAASSASLATAAELNTLAGVTAGTVTASKAVVVDANKDIGSFRNLRTTRTVHAEGAAVSVNTAGAATIAAATMVGGIYVRDPNGAGRTDTFDSAANLVAALPGAAVGDIIDLLIVNGADAAEAITLAVPASGSFDGNQTASSRVIGQNTSKMVRIRLTNVTGGTEAYVVYA